MEKTVFIGNGINRIASNYAWPDLLEDLKTVVGKNANIINGDKPFPLLYEEIYFRARQFKQKEENDLLSYIVHKMRDLAPNQIHEMIMNSKIKNIITTNYDYALEQVFEKDEKKIKSINTISRNAETKFRITTKNLIKDKSIWHIHGELKKMETIVLGQGKYSKTLSRINTYMESKDFLPESQNSWIDLMFYHDIHMIGFGLNYSEIDIWLVLNERIRYYYSKNQPPINKIYFYLYDAYAKNTMDLEMILDSFAITVIKNDPEESATEFYKRSLLGLEK